MSKKRRSMKLTQRERVVIKALREIMADVNDDGTSPNGVALVYTIVHGDTIVEKEDKLGLATSGRVAIVDSTRQGSPIEMALYQGMLQSGVPILEQRLRSRVEHSRKELGFEFDCTEVQDRDEAPFTRDDVESALSTKH